MKHKTMMGMLYKKAVTLPEEKKNAEVKVMIETYNKFAGEEAIIPEFMNAISMGE